jgi:hypothetical protein
MTISRIFYVLRSLRSRRAATNSFNGPPTSLRPGEFAFGNNENTLYIGKTNGTVISLTSGGGGGIVSTTASASGAVTTDASAADIFDLTLTGNVTLANPTNPVDGKTIRWRIRQDATGSRTVTLGGQFVIPSTATDPLPFSTTANKMDILAATYHAGREKWDIIAFVPGY